MFARLIDVNDDELSSVGEPETMIGNIGSLITCLRVVQDGSGRTRVGW